MPDLEILQDPKTIIRVKSSDAETHSTETLAQWESSARAAKWESEKGNEQEDGSALVCAAVSRGSQQAQRTLAALQSVLGEHVIKVMLSCYDDCCFVLCRIALKICLPSCVGCPPR